MCQESRVITELIDSDPGISATGFVDRNIACGDDGSGRGLSSLDGHIPVDVDHATGRSGRDRAAGVCFVAVLIVSGACGDILIVTKIDRGKINAGGPIGATGSRDGDIRSIGDGRGAINIPRDGQ